LSELIEAGFDKRFVRAVFAKVQASQYKRRLPLIAKVSSRTIDRDFRYPRNWGK
jgi:NAD+ synthase